MDFNEILEQYDKANAERETARQAAKEAYEEYDKRRADKDYAEACFNGFSFQLRETHGDQIPDDERAKLERLEANAANAVDDAKRAWEVYEQKKSDCREANAKVAKVAAKLSEHMSPNG